jgi:CBS domain-containing protein
MAGNETATRLEAIPVAEAMHPGVLSCPREATLGAVARMMATYSVHCVVVFDEGAGPEADSLWGVVSDLDLAAGLAEGDVEERTAGQVAASPVVTISAEDPIRRAAQLMVEHSAAHLLVVDPDSRPVGILSTLDLARVAAQGGLR